MKQISINEGWKLCMAPLSWDSSYYGEIKQKKEGWMECSLPADIHMPLMKYGYIKDPVKADYCFAAEWTEKYSWWFLKNFSSDEIDMSSEGIELILEQLDTDAVIWLNDHLLGTHNSVHYPFVADIKRYLKEGTNYLMVRVSTGLEKIDDSQLAQLNWAVCREQDNGGEGRSDYRRAFVRRPQYTVGWDWGPRVVTCGITGNAQIRCMKEISIREVYVQTESIYKDQAKLQVEVCLDNLNLLSTRVCDLKIGIYKEGKLQAEVEKRDMLLTSGYNYIKIPLTVEHPELWWPNGYGSQPMYKVCCLAKTERSTERKDIKYGIRTIRLNTESLKGDNRKFQIMVNGVPVFCKGGDWIPNDSIYARVTDEKIQYLLEEAVNANFNMLRIWGGGLYERDKFYETCSEKGILIWHDFMFACATYPDHLDEFRKSVYLELDYQTKRLRNYPCMAIFCGSNENHWLFNKYDNPQWEVEFARDRQLGLYVANYMAKDAVHRNCPDIPYWNSSPYGGNLPNDNTVGDIHYWRPGYMSADIEERITPELYDKITAKFVSEYGCIGPCGMASVEEYMDGHPLDRSGKIWKNHCNVFEKGTVEAGIRKNYALTGKDLPMEDYILYGGMVQSQILQYSLESLRFNTECYGALFWMYNDTWGETGWTVIDYYLRRKISYYGVKRALEHVKCILRTKEGNIELMVCNDTSEDVVIEGEWGYVSFDGTIKETKPVKATVPSASRRCICQEVLPDRDYEKGTIMFLPQGGNIGGAYLRTREMKELLLGNTLDIHDIHKEGDYSVVQLGSKGFVHGVHILGGYLCSDNYFDILPGETKKVFVRNLRDEKLEIRQIL